MLSSTWESACTMHYAPRAGKIFICQSNTETEGAVTLRSLCPFRRRGAPSPQTFNPQIKHFCILTIQVLCINYTNSFSQLTTAETQTIILPQCTPKQRQAARGRKNCCFTSLLLSTKYKTNNFFFNSGKAK